MITILKRTININAKNADVDRHIAKKMTWTFAYHAINGALL